MITPTEIEHLLFVGGLWLAIALVWAVSCVWIDADAVSVFGGRQGRRWSLAWLAVGVGMFLTTAFLGFATLPLFIGVVPFGLSTYAVLRDKRVKPEDRVFSRAFVSRAIVALAEKAGCGDEVERWLTRRPKGQVVAKAVSGSSSAVTVPFALPDSDAWMYGRGEHCRQRSSVLEAQALSGLQPHACAPARGPLRLAQRAQACARRAPGPVRRPLGAAGLALSRMPGSFKLPG